ncbi:hypothetical protein PMSM_07275 [Paenibacillus macquariensis subsp. macquariensis]|nr:hypothetical protein PMSM_07275 [Paenibacillus macquariensis subsp. macquariensis]
MDKPTTSSVTSQDWKDIEQKLMGLYNRAILICDGYELSIVLERRDQFKNVIRIYVNGAIEGKWYMADCEERRRFFCPRTKNLYSKKELSVWKKISKKEYANRIAKKYYYYEPCWLSFRSLKSHLIKNNKNIEIVLKDGE